MPKKINIVKASGETAPYSRAKIERSLRRSGASHGLAKKIALDVEAHLVVGMTTHEIYNLAFELLKKAKERPIAARYSLKKAIAAFGPTGFPFERFIGEIFKRKGFKVQVGVIVSGKCVNHEVDVIAEDERKHYFMECKFHSGQVRATDVKVALYVHSRFRDIIEKINQKGLCHEIHKAWVITNTRLSRDAIVYGECNNMKMIGWNYPKNRGVEVLIEETGLHPVTSLTTLSYDEKKRLLENNIVLVQDLPNKIKFLGTIGIREKKLVDLLKEVKALCGESNGSN
ncbi:MAG: ATP cone domain-containing protein [bacterium]|nr:ATP cone domain-containing protein [bacterium]